MRTFIAISLPLPIQERLQAIQTHLRTLLGDGGLRWSQPSGIHLTLAFLGNVDDTRVEPLAADLRAICRDAVPMTLALGRLGAFPDLLRPRVIWVGLTGDLANLASLQESVRRATAPYAEHPEDKPFHPHLTLARVRPNSRGLRGLADPLEATSAALQPAGWTANQLHLFRSELRPQGPVYTSLALIQLASADPPQDGLPGGLAISVESKGTDPRATRRK